MTCGDGVLDPGEQCDDGKFNSDDQPCKSDCTLQACGDGYVGPGEECDDKANGDQDDGCTDMCKFPACGDGFVQPSLNEACDQGVSNSDTGACTLACKVAVCSDGFVHAGVETCDDGNANEFDACNMLCKPTPTSIATQPGALLPIEQADIGFLPFDDACPANTVLIGVKGGLNGNGYITQVYGVCAPQLVTDGGGKFKVSAGAASNLPPRGGIDQGAWSAMCSPGHVLVGFRGTKSTLFHRLVFRCAPVGIAVGMNSTYSVTIGAVVELPEVGIQFGGQSFGPYNCPVGHVASRQRGSTTNLLTSFGLACATVQPAYP